MATRFYLPSSGTAPASPAFASSWTLSGSAVRRPMPTTPSNTGSAVKQVLDTSSGAVDVLAAQFISEPLAAGSISGTFSLVVGCAERQSTDNMFLRVVARVVSSDGSTVRGTLYSNTVDTEFPVSPTYLTRIVSGAALSSVTAQANDRIVVEVGATNTGTSTTITRFAEFVFEDRTASTDLALTSEVAADSSVNKRPWVEFSQNLSFAAAGTTISGGQATETASALAGAVVVGALLAGGMATETDTAQAGTVLEPTVIAGGRATEADTGRAGSIILADILFGTRATETDTAQAGTIRAGSVIAGGQATETDTANAGTVDATVNITIIGGTASELDTATGGDLTFGYGATDTANRVGGRVRGAYAVATWDPPVADPPPTIVHGESRDVTHAYGDVTMNGTQPVFDVDEAHKARHRDRIVVGGRDVTYFRGVPTPLPAYQLVSPLLYGPATMRVPQVAAAFERLGVGDRAWLAPEKTVKIQRVDENGDVVATDYKGVIVALNTSGGDLTVEIGGEASGRAALRERPLPIFRQVNDVGRLAYHAIRGIELPFSPRLGPDTGIEIARFGGTGLLDYISQLCARAWTRGGNQWTIMPVGGVYKMFRKDTTTVDATAYLDDSRTVGDLRRDIAEEPNRIFATGVTPEGQRVRFGAYPGLKQGKAAPYPFRDDRNFGVGTTNAETATGDGITVMLDRLWVTKYMNAPEATGGFDADAAEAIRQLQDDAGLPVTGTMTPATWRALYDLDATGFSLRQSRVEPAAQRGFTREWNRSASGAIMGRNPNYDRRRLKVDRSIDLGSGFWVKQMREFARAEVDASEDNWVGTITFHTGALVAGNHSPGDPLGGDDVFRARRLQPGMNIRLPHSPGGDITVHVSAVSVDEDGKVTATVDTRARDTMAVWEVLQRNRESRRDPARQWIRDHRASGQIKDAIDGWDEVGGLLGDRITLEAHKWRVIEVVAGQEGTVQALRTRTDPNAEYVMAVFGRQIHAKRLARLIGNPLTKAGAKRWEDDSVRNQLDRDRFLLYVAGDKEQPLGYYPKEKRPDTVITEEPNPDYDPSADSDEVGTDDEPTIEVETESGSITPLTGRWEDAAGFSYRTFLQPVVYVAVYADRDTSIPAGRLMWPQLEAGA